MQLNCYEPWRHPAQWEFLNLDRSSSDGRLRHSHFVGGRGSAKTTTGVLLLLRSTHELNPGLPHLWTEPTFRDIEDTFLRTWSSIVPQELWTLNRSLMRIRCLATGSEIDLRSRQKDFGRGPNYAAWIDDESAKNFDERGWMDIAASVREPRAEHRFIATLSTPLMNGYYALCHRDGHEVVHSTSYDNPFLSSEYARQLEADLSPDYARQEVYGEWVSQSGRCWRHFSQDPWPGGNMVDAAYDPGRPFVLAGDIGVRSGWLIIQRFDPDELGCAESRYPVDVVVGEYTPNAEGAEQTIGRIDSDFGQPAHVYIGADVNTRSVTTAQTTAYFIGQRWGKVRITYPRGSWADKQIQYSVASSRILNTAGHRRFAVSSDRFQGEASGRGIVEVMLQDSFPEREHVGQFFDKDKSRGGIGLEDMRDAFLYWAVCAYPPSARRTDTWAE